MTLITSSLLLFLHRPRPSPVRNDFLNFCVLDSTLLSRLAVPLRLVCSFFLAFSRPSGQPTHLSWTLVCDLLQSVNPIQTFFLEPPLCFRFMSIAVPLSSFFFQGVSSGRSLKPSILSPLMGVRKRFRGPPCEAVCVFFFSSENRGLSFLLRRLFLSDPEWHILIAHFPQTKCRELFLCRPVVPFYVRLASEHSVIGKLFQDPFPSFTK